MSAVGSHRSYGGQQPPTGPSFTHGQKLLLYVVRHMVGPFQLVGLSQPFAIDLVRRDSQHIKLKQVPKLGD